MGSYETTRIGLAEEVLNLDLSIEPEHLVPILRAKSVRFNQANGDATLLRRAAELMEEAADQLSGAPADRKYGDGDVATARVHLATALHRAAMRAYTAATKEKP